MSEEFNSQLLNKLSVENDNDKVPSRIQSIYDSCTSEERRIMRQILDELSRWGESDTYNSLWLADFKEKPVSMDTFLCDDAYLGNTNNHGAAVFPYWRKTMNEIFDAGNKYNEVVFTGATRIGKSSTANSCIAYMLYKLMCMKNPQRFYNLKDISTISIFFFNLTIELARGVAFKEFMSTLQASPWFNAHGTFTKSDRYPIYVPEGGKVNIAFGSSGVHALGSQCYAAFCDEIAFAKAGVKDINKSKRDMQELYNIVSARIKGTFRKDGEVHGKLFAVSSKNTESDFMEDYIQRQMSSGAGENMYIVDKPQWEILPASKFSKERFWIAVGSKNQRGFVVPENQSDEAGLADIKAQGFKLLNPPLDMRPEFVADFDIALRDLAGIAVPGTLSFITQDSLDKCIDKTRRNPFYTDILSIGTKDVLTIEEFFHMEAIDPRKKHLNNYIHLDLSLNTDKTGISMICEDGRKEIEMENGKKMFMPNYYHVFSIAIEATRGDKIPYDKILRFILWLRRQGFNIARTSRDQFQSEYMGQLIEANGIPSDKISLDRTPDGYMALRSILLEQRINMLNVAKLQDELIHLQRDAFSGKIDHPIDNSKDTADSFAGSIWNCMLHATDNVKMPQPSSMAKAIASVNRGSRTYVSKNNNQQTTTSNNPFAGTVFSNYKKY